MDDLLILPRMARRLGVTQQWLREQVDANTVPCLRAGNRYLFNPAAVQKALAVKAAKMQEGGNDAK
jgi:excisionase family DNA binding protein